MTMQLIETKTLGTAAASIEFTSIPQDGTDLVLMASLREAPGASNLFLQFRITINGVTTSTVRTLQGSGSSVGSFTNSLGELGPNISGTTSTTSTFGSINVYIPNYSSTIINKSFSYDGVMENNATTSYQNISAGLYSSTTAITSLGIRGVDGAGTQRNLAVDSIISLYKITKGAGGATVS